MIDRIGLSGAAGGSVSRMGSRWSRGRSWIGSVMGIVASLLPLLLCACSHTYHRPHSVAAEVRPAHETIYLIGDFGDPNAAFQGMVNRLVAALERDAEGGTSLSAPWILGLGDNLYSRGLPRSGVADNDPWARLRQLETGLQRCRWKQQPVRVAVVPGNHDYDNDALLVDREYGDITGWWGGKLSWAHYPPGPGATPPDYPQLYSSLEILTDVMAPMQVPTQSSDLFLVALDSELIIDLFRDGHDPHAHRYLARLDQVLEGGKGASWRVVACHHPIVTRGTHNPHLGWGRYWVGPGWPQFPRSSQWLMAVPPLGTLVTVGRWAIHHTQDAHSQPQRQFARGLLEILQRHQVSLLLSGHDHNLQLQAVTSVPRQPSTAPGLLQVVSGAGCQLDSTSAGEETHAHHVGHGFFRLQVWSDTLQLEMIDDHGAVQYRQKWHR